MDSDGHCRSTANGRLRATLLLLVDPNNVWCISEDWGRFGEVKVEARSNLQSAVDIKVCKGCKVWIDVSFSEDICED